MSISHSRISTSLSLRMWAPKAACGLLSGWNSLMLTMPPPNLPFATD